jgi:hypothetical protein
VVRDSEHAEKDFLKDVRHVRDIADAPDEEAAQLIAVRVDQSRDQCVGIARAQVRSTTEESLASDIRES